MVGVVVECSVLQVATDGNGSAFGILLLALDLELGIRRLSKISRRPYYMGAWIFLLCHYQLFQ